MACRGCLAQVAAGSREQAWCYWEGLVLVLGEESPSGWAGHVEAALGDKGGVLAAAMVVSPLGLPPAKETRALLLIGVLWNWLSRAQPFLGAGPDWSYCFN